MTEYKYNCNNLLINNINYGNCELIEDSTEKWNIIPESNLSEIRHLPIHGHIKCDEINTENKFSGIGYIFNNQLITGLRPLIKEN